MINKMLRTCSEGRNVLLQRQLLERRAAARVVVTNVG